MHVGPRFASSKQAALSETGTEYEVQVVKHVYASHILLQFHLNNTLEDQLLEDVTIKLDLSGVAGLELDSELKCASLPFGSPGDCFVCLRRTEGVPVGTVPCSLKFLVKDVDPSSGEPAGDEPGYDDEYNLEELEIAAADFVKKVAVVDFKEAWNTIGADCEVIETFSLSYTGIKQAMDAVIDTSASSHATTRQTPSRARARTPSSSRVSSSVAPGLPSSTCASTQPRPSACACACARPTRLCLSSWPLRSPSRAARGGRRRLRLRGRTWIYPGVLSRGTCARSQGRRADGECMWGDVVWLRRAGAYFRQQGGIVTMIVTSVDDAHGGAVPVRVLHGFLGRVA